MPKPRRADVEVVSRLVIVVGIDHDADLVAREPVVAPGEPRFDQPRLAVETLDAYVESLIIVGDLEGRLFRRWFADLRIILDEICGDRSSAPYGIVQNTIEHWRLFAG